MTNTDNAPPAPVQLLRMMSGYTISQMIHVAAKLDLADRLVTTPKTAEELANETNTHPRSLYRLLRALASVGIFAEEENGQFTLTPLAEPLREDSPESKKAAAVMLGEEHYLAYADLLHSIQTGETAFEKRFGQPIFDYLSENSGAAKTFDGAMTSIHGPETKAMIQAYDFSKFGTLIDVGGGNGSTLFQVLRHCPDLKGIVFDLPSVVERTQQRILEAGLHDRCQAVGGNFFDGIPKGGDAYLLRHIIHDWEDAKSVAILKRCREAMNRDARLLVAEGVIGPGNEPSSTKLLDIAMMVIPGGQERTEPEYKQLFHAAGLRLTRIVPTEAAVSLIEGVPATE
ncbi:MAG: methyltransferase [Gemmataceae bacterium]